MVHPISSIPRRIILLSSVVIVIVIIILLSVAPLVDPAPQVFRREWLNYLIYAPLLAILFLLGAHLYLRPISTLGRTLDLGSTPSKELLDAARRVAFDAPRYFFVFPALIVCAVCLFADILGSLILPDYRFIDHAPSSVLVTALAAAGVLIVSVVSQQWLRPVLLYAAPKSPVIGRRANIRARLLAIMLSLTLISVALSGFYAYNHAVKTYREHLASQALLYLERTIYLMPGEMQQNNVLDYIIDTLPHSVEYESIFLVDADGQILDQRAMTAQVGVAFDGEAWRTDHDDCIRQANGYVCLFALDLHDHAVWVGIGYQINPLHSKLVIDTLIMLGIYGAGMVTLVVVISRYLAESMILDLRFVTGRLHDIANQERMDLTRPVPVPSFDEVGDLVIAYNALQERVHFQQQQIENEQNQLIVLQSLSYKIGNIRDVEQLLAEVVQDVEYAFGYQNVCMLLVDESRQELYVAAANHQHLNQIGQRFNIDQGSAVGQGSIVGRVANTGVPFLADDVGTCDVAVPQPLGVCSEMAVPLTIGDRIIGVFDVSSELEGAFDERDLHIVTALGNQIAIAVENARLIHEALSDAHELERQAQNQTALRSISMALSTSLQLDDVLNIATENLVRLLHVDHSTVFFFEATDRSSKVQAEYPGQRLLGQEIPIKNFPALRRLLTIGTPMFIADVQHDKLMVPVHELLKSLDIQSMLLVPLQSKGAIVGVLTLDTIGRKRTFAPQEIAVCQTIAAQVAVSVENAQLFESMNTQADMLVRMTRDVSAERSKLDAVLRYLVDGLLVTDTVGRILIVNPSFLAMFDLKQREYTHKYISDVVPQIPLQHLILQTCYDEVVHTHEFALNDGRFLQCTAAVVYQDNQVSGVVIVLRDITRTKQLDQLRSTFISNVSHELRTPLTIIDGFAQRIDKSFMNDILPLLVSSKDRAVQRITRNMGYLLSGVKRLENLVEDVLILADIDAGRFEWHIQDIDVGPVFQAVADVYRPQIEAKGLAMHVHIPASVPVIKGDAERLALVLDNLISNAVKFTDAGEITLSVQAIQRQDGQWHPVSVVDMPDLLIQDAYVLTVVTDTGPGISLSEQQVLFERFRQGMDDMLTSKPAGTGLGLPICKEIVSYHGGHIWVESEPGKSSFAFVIPLVSCDLDHS
ncbi:MAG: GAF domain-containing protein [Anaerolineae bacterium]|nr:GAF domain-containing protein [Anaerolineae bacterium]